MRAVTHYNDFDNQKKILLNAYNSLENGGYLIIQLSSGSKENCKLRSDIVNHPSLERGENGEGKYLWLSIKEFESILKEIGFKKINLAGYATPCSWGPEEQWLRAHENEYKLAKKDKDCNKIALLDKHRTNFLLEANKIIESLLIQRMFIPKSQFV